MTADCAPYRQQVGGYVLGGLDVDDVREVEAHLRDCPACRAERDELAALLPLLDCAREAAPQVPTRVRDRVVAQATRRRTARRWAGIAAAAAAIGLAVGVVAGVQLGPRASPALVVPLEHVEPFEASGWATFQSEDERVLLELELAGLDPLEPPSVYEAWLSTADERVVSIGQLGTAPDGTATATLVAEGQLEDYRGFWITAEPDGRDPAHDGPSVLRAPVPPPR